MCTISLMGHLPKTFEVQIEDHLSHIELVLRGPISEKTVMDISMVPPGKPVFIDVKGILRKTNSM